MDSSFSKFDFWRGFSAVVVVVAHAAQVFLYNYDWLYGYKFYISNAAILAVVIFFLLSGFLVSKSIVFNCQKYGYFNWVEYFSSRLARIYPPFLFSLFVVFAVYIIVRSFGLPGSSVNLFDEGVAGHLGRSFFSISFREFVSSVVMLGGLHSLNGPLWSLYYEFQLYVLMMFLMCGVLNGRLTPLIIFLFLLSFLISFRREFPVYAFLWCLGAAWAFWGGAEMV